MRHLRALAVLAVVLVLLALGFVKLTSDRAPRGAPRLGRGISGLEVDTTAKLRLSPDGARVAVVERGALTVLRVNDARVVMHTGANVVDAAWMPDSKRVLVVEGPIPTGQVATIDMTGHVDGATQLNPSIAFGAGDGVAVDARGTRAAVIAVTRDAIGGATHTDLATIDLQSGAVRIYATPRNESAPVFVDEGQVAVASQGRTGPARLDLVDLSTGGVDAGRPIIDGPFGVTFGGDVVVARRAAQGAYRLIAISPNDGDERTLHVTKPHRHVVAVDAEVTRCLVRVLDRGGGAHLEFETF